MTSAVVDSGGSGLEFDNSEVENQEENKPVSEYPAVIVEPVPSARLEQGYAAQVLVYDDETYLMQDVAEEQEIETESVETGNSRQMQLISCVHAYFLFLNVPK
uniref:E74 like ETS transcription factor 2 n=1 Tax=Gopherus evgoodei TaxID=1825980 RepID=A0A8C4WAD6_9SAUR